jgi:hypothetical protein
MKIYKILFISFLLTFVSCDDFLKLEPGEQISINEQLATKTGLELALNGMYYDIEALFSSQQYLYADFQGGNITFSPKINNKEINVPSIIENSYTFNDLREDSNYAGFYTALYDIINQANVVLSYFNSYTFLSIEESQQLQAELLAIRAFAHYNVANMYAQNYNFTPDASHLGIIYNTTPLIGGVDFPSRKTLKKTYELLKTDLDTSLSLFTNTSFLPGIPYSLFTKITTQALYARIALQMNDWEQAYTHANAIITSAGIVLTSEENYVLEWEKEEDPISEIIFDFSAPRTSEGAVAQSISQWFEYESDDNYGRHVASGDLLYLYTIDDIRTQMFIRQEIPTKLTGVEINLPYYFTKKYQDDTGTPYIRLSEMYLIRAEANARMSKQTLALIDLNTIRERANLNALNTTTNLLEEIFLERRRELAFEGHLLYDIARYKKNVARDKGCLANVCNLNYPSNFFVLPIPESSIELNENMQQNEGY